jgi:hypothetical protein
MRPQDLVDITLAVSAAQLHMNSPPAPTKAQRRQAQVHQAAGARIQQQEQHQKAGRSMLFSESQAASDRDQASSSRVRWFVDDLIAAVVKHLPDLNNQQLASLVALTSELPATQSRLFLRALARELAAKVRCFQSPILLPLLCQLGICLAGLL